MALALVPAMTAYAADNGPGQYQINVTTTLRMRAGPGTDYDVIASIPNNTNVLVTETQDGWGKIEFGGETGWISLDYAIYYADIAGNAVEGDQRSEIVRIAQGEVGYKEGSNNYTKYGVWYASWAKNSPWCGIFVSWCAYHAGVPESIIPKFSYCATGIELFKSLGVWKSRSYVPQAGDIIFFRSSYASSASDHVGIVTSCDGKRVYTIEGNSSDKVSERSYSLSDSYIVGYASPKYQKPTPTTTTTTTATTTSAPTTTESTTASTTAAAPGGTVSQRLTVSGSIVSVRTEADIDSQRLATVRRGEQFDLLGTETDDSDTIWYKISIGGKIGYIKGESVALTAAPEQDDSAGQLDNCFAVVTGSPVNVRDGAGTSYERLGEVYRGDILTVTGSTTAADGLWYEVEFDGQTGYICGDYAKLCKEVRVTGAAVNVRADAGTGSARVGTVRRGQCYVLLGCKNDASGAVWYAVEYNGKTVYICADYAKPVY